MLGGAPEQAALGHVEGQFVIGEVAGEVLGLAERGRVGVGRVLAGAPVGGPEWVEQALGEAASGEAQNPARATPEQAAAWLLELDGGLSPALRSLRAERVVPDREAVQRLGEATVEGVGVAQLVGEDGGSESVSIRPRLRISVRPRTAAAGRGSSRT